MLSSLSTHWYKVRKSETAGAFEAGKANAYHHKQGEVRFSGWQIALGNFQNWKRFPNCFQFPRLKEKRIIEYVLFNAL